mgnify:CR=1 FL=1
MAKSLSIIIGSTRTNRVGHSIAEWVGEQAKEAGFDEIKLLDLKEINLPKFDTPVPPQYAPLETAEAKAWAQQINDAQHILVLTPEYNRSIPASLKSAIDYLSAEWNNKPVAIAGYGYIGAAANARKHLGEILGFLKTDIVEETAGIQLGDATLVDGAFTGAGVTSEETAIFDTVLTALAAK